MSDREQKALVIAATSKLKKLGNVWSVPSQSGKGAYRVDLRKESPFCSCPDHELRGVRCKHILAVEIVIKREQTTEEMSDGTTVVTETVTATKRVTYRQEWTAYNQAQTNEKHLFESLLSELCSGIGEPEQTMGRPRLMYKDMVFASAFKVYCGMSARRFTTDFCEAQVKGHVSKSAHFNSVNRYLANPALTPLLHELITASSLPLKAIESDFAVDSSGFSTSKSATWFNAKYGEQHTALDWLKAHLMCGVKTNVVTSVEISGRFGSDYNYLPPLVEKTVQHFNVQEVSADKAYSGRTNYAAIAKVGATPYIAFRSNASGGVGGIYEKMYHYFCYNRDEFLVKYHKRSNVESTFSMIKSKFGSSLRSKTRVAQVNEALCKILCHNICCLIQSMFEFGIEPNFV
jgi:transposase/predicted nucleic acid-binding Zn finger protein